MLDILMEGRKKLKVVIPLEIAIAALFVVGAGWAGEAADRFFKSYFADIIIPFAFYFLLLLNENEVGGLKKWRNKAVVIFTMCAASETLQYFGIYALATVFDPLDFLMYATGTTLAVVVDRTVFKRVFGFWD